MPFSILGDKERLEKGGEEGVQFGRIEIRPVQWQRQPEIRTHPQTRQER